MSLNEKYTESAEVNCIPCGGTGKVRHGKCEGNGCVSCMYLGKITCLDCSGSGKVAA